MSGDSVSIFKFPYTLGAGGRVGLWVGGRLSIMAYTGGSAQNGSSLRIDHSSFFSTFDMDKLKIPLEMNVLKLNWGRIFNMVAN